MGYFEFWVTLMAYPTHRLSTTSMHHQPLLEPLVCHLSAALLHDDLPVTYFLLNLQSAFVSTFDRNTSLSWFFMVFSVSGNISLSRFSFDSILIVSLFYSKTHMICILLLALSYFCDDSIWLNCTAVFMMMMFFFLLIS